MFLAIRRELPHVEGLAGGDAAGGSGAALAPGARRWGETLLAAILPFFALYVAWNLIRDDFIDYGFAQTEQDNFGASGSFEVSVSAITITLVVVAFGLRTLLSRFGSRLPRWSNAVATYLEAVWVFVAAVIIQELVAGLGAWLSTRRMFAWAVDGWADLRASLSWLGGVLDAIGWAVGQFGTLVGLPLAWLAFASIIYFGAMPRSARAPSARLAEAGSRWSRMPGWLRRVAQAIAAGLLDRWRPVALAARLIWNAGPIVLGSYLLAFTALQVGEAWARLLIYRLVGPHPTGWWFGASDGIELAVAIVFGVLQVTLVAAAFERALAGDAASAITEQGAAAVSAAAAPGAAPRSS
jgi:hypothetical protein